MFKRVSKLWSAGSLTKCPQWSPAGVETGSWELNPDCSLQAAGTQSLRLLLLLSRSCCSSMLNSRVSQESNPGNPMWSAHMLTIGRGLDLDGGHAILRTHVSLCCALVLPSCAQVSPCLFLHFFKIPPAHQDPWPY